MKNISIICLLILFAVGCSKSIMTAQNDLEQKAFQSIYIDKHGYRLTDKTGKDEYLDFSKVSIQELKDSLDRDGDGPGPYYAYNFADYADPRSEDYDLILKKRQAFLKYQPDKKSVIYLFLPENIESSFILMQIYPENSIDKFLTNVYYNEVNWVNKNLAELLEFLQNNNYVFEITSKGRFIKGIHKKDAPIRIGPKRYTSDEEPLKLYTVDVFFKDTETETLPRFIRVTVLGS